MRSIMKSYLVQLFCFTTFLLCIRAKHFDILTPEDQLGDHDFLMSPNKKSNVSFYTPGDNTLRYLCVLFVDEICAWIANRDNPIEDSSGILKISKDGYMIIYSDDDNSLSITVNQGQPATGNNISLSLTDTGNLVLRAGEQIVWQSFDQPVDNILPGMQIGLINHPSKWVLNSWLSATVPTPGAFSLGVDPNNTKQIVIWRRGEPYWQSGTWDGKKFPYMDGDFSYVSNDNESVFVFVGLNGLDSPRIMLTSTGNFLYIGSNDTIDQVDKFRYCDEALKLKGQLWPPNPGCIGLKPSNCEMGDEFGKANFKIYTTTELNWDNMENESLGLSDCKELCRKNCSCVAYTTFYDNIECGFVYGQVENLLLNIEEYSGGAPYFVRQSILREKVNSTTAKHDKPKGKIRKGLIIGGSTAASCVLILVSFYLLWSSKRCLRGGDNEATMYDELDTTIVGSSHCDMPKPDSKGKKKNCELPFFKFSTIKNATNNFSEENLLGRGGFGPVYKGILDHKHEVAMKRLSPGSKQGLKEFKTEVILISKLQHKNLVRLLGCCIHNEERILVYEYLPNKSLETFLFEAPKQHLLDWKMRFNIIEGIAQGLLYLHKYSRLKIIHRDLKASNILLDSNMTPKIADFGTARVFEENESEAETRRIVGTYGYMSPEYAIDGLFSEKSDVFAFGVIILEIVTGKRSVSLYSSENVLTYAWDFWKEKRALEMIEPALDQVYSCDEVLRCIHVGLLCVQESAIDRPTMSDIVSLLTNESITWEPPKQPAFVKFLGSSNEMKALELSLSDSVKYATISDIGTQ